jgi:hypothetical protein
MHFESAFVVVPHEQGIVVQTQARILRSDTAPIADALIEIRKAETDRPGALRWKGTILVPLGHFLPEGSQCTLLIGDTVLLEVVIRRVELASERIIAHFETAEHNDKTASSCQGD